MSPEEEQEQAARAFLREAWAKTPHLMARYRSPSNRVRTDILHNTMAYRRTEEFGGKFVEFVERAQVLALNGGRCARCAEPISGEYHVDHIVPLKHGGDHSYGNTQPLHPECHRIKSAAE